VSHSSVQQISQHADALLERLSGKIEAAEPPFDSRRCRRPFTAGHVFTDTSLWQSFSAARVAFPTSTHASPKKKFGASGRRREAKTRAQVTAAAVNLR